MLGGSRFSSGIYHWPDFKLVGQSDLMGDNASARISYEEFLAIWKNADPDIPIYKQAKAEYAGLSNN
jgi:hypothetical protein